jgi:hypothetical protein
MPSAVAEFEHALAAANQSDGGECACGKFNDGEQCPGPDGRPLCAGPSDTSPAPQAVEGQPVHPITMPEYRYQEMDARVGNATYGTVTQPVLVPDPNSASGQRVEYHAVPQAIESVSVDEVAIKAAVLPIILQGFRDRLSGNEVTSLIARALLAKFNMEGQ